MQSSPQSNYSSNSKGPRISPAGREHPRGRGVAGHNVHRHHGGRLRGGVSGAWGGVSTALNPRLVGRLRAQPDIGQFVPIITDVMCSEKSKNFSDVPDHAWQCPGMSRLREMSIFPWIKKEGIWKTTPPLGPPTGRIILSLVLRSSLLRLNTHFSPPDC
ncbi:hypothetical protein ES705_16731 [subsurface metagenome]